MLAAKMEEKKELDEKEDDEKKDPDDEESIEIDLRLVRLEDLMSRRPLLVNSVLLRQNPHNVLEWQKRVTLMGTDPEKIIMTYTEAVTTVDPQQATGKPHLLWVNFAKYYESHDDLANARTVFERSTHANYKSIDHLAALWCEYAEMELRHENYKEALQVMKTATTVPPRAMGRLWKKEEEQAHVQERLYKSTKLWAFYADLEENLGTLESTKAVYEQILTLKVATPQLVINYAHFMEEHKFFRRLIPSL